MSRKYKVTVVFEVECSNNQRAEALVEAMLEGTSRPAIAGPKEQIEQVEGPDAEVLS